MLKLRLVLVCGDDNHEDDIARLTVVDAPPGA